MIVREQPSPEIEILIELFAALDDAGLLALDDDEPAAPIESGSDE